MANWLGDSRGMGMLSTSMAGQPECRRLLQKGAHPFHPPASSRQNVTPHFMDEDTEVSAAANP